MVSSSPRLVEPADLYDGPEPALPLPPGEVPRKPEIRSRRDYIATITAALDMLGSRILALIAVLAACAIWFWAVYDPIVIRTYAATAFSLTVLMPTILLYWRKG